MSAWVTSCLRIWSYFAVTATRRPTRSAPPKRPSGWYARLSGWAEKRYGEYWEEMGIEVVEEEFQHWLEDHADDERYG
jgi:hypothetical protein